MTIAQLNAMSPDELVKDFDTYLDSLKPATDDKAEKIPEWIKEYDMDHAIFDRQDKIVGEGDSARTVEVAKLGIPFQKKIVNTATSFLFGQPVKLIKNNEEEQFDELYNNFTAAWKQAKLNYHNRKLARRLMVETRVAELFYIRTYNKAEPNEETEEDEQANFIPQNGENFEKKLKVLLLCQKNGDDIFPVWDSLGDLVGFIRQYTASIEVEGEVKDVEMAEIYTDRFNYVCQKLDEWTVQRYANPFGKIPVIYYEQGAAEWADVQSLIERVEFMVSTNADTNDYFGSPAVVAKGELKSAPEKGEVGKVFEVEPTIVEGRATFGDLSYLTWDRAPEAIKLEYETLKDLIYSQTATPDLSFNNVKGTTNLSGIALKFMFLDSLLKAMDKEEVFGEGLERRISLLKRMLSVVDLQANKGMEDLDISVEFASVLPENIQELITTLQSAVGGSSIMSQESAVKQNPLVEDPEAEITLLEGEREKEQLMNESYGFPAAPSNQES
jgi:SPP1 family phage portal protein